MTARLVRIRGKVQGVWYRSWTVEQAAQRGVRGWVRNRQDGSVEALFAGEPAMIDEMISVCRKGPRLARVDSISSEPTVEEPPAGFEQRPTA
ncbi:MAG TPA: acylphosphatase [Dongiaceae bacterium]|jgi:acylphosphatase|nr:acylphosphatase [Dongiaceae bacterium]